MSTELDPIEPAQLQALLNDMLPRPVQHSLLSGNRMQMVGGEPGEIVVELGPHDVTVSEYAVTATKQTELTLSPRQLGVVHWAALPGWTTRRILAELTAAASQLRRSRFKECLRCKKLFPPEVFTEANTCAECAASEEGVVY